MNTSSSLLGSKSLLSVTVGITAYNEESNITNLLQQLIKQTECGFILKEILVISDGSSDNTVTKARSVFSDRIRVESSPERLGKPARINQIFEETKTDVVVLLDADISIDHPFMVTELLKPFLDRSEVRAVFGRAHPMRATTLVQYLANVGWEIWDQLRTITAGADLYRCEGTIRAFHKDLYTIMRFPDSSADDVFPFLYCNIRNISVAFSNAAEVSYVSPRTYGDYLKQALRFSRSKSVQIRHFPKDFVESFYVISLRNKLGTLFAFFLEKPFSVAAYGFLVLYTRFIVFCTKQKLDTSVWSIATSTKTIQ